MNTDVELLGSYWTTAGPVEIHGGREWSLFDFAERCAQAVRVGMSGIGLWHADLDHQLETRTLADIRRIIDDHGLRHVELEFLNDWFLDVGTEARAASDDSRRRLFEAADRLGAHHIKVGNIYGTPCEYAQVVDRFGELCEDAAKAHDILLTYETMPFDLNAPSLDAAIGIVEGAGADNGGLALDFWHLGKFGLTPQDLRRIPPRYLSYVELSDGMIANMPDHTEETTKYRRLPGEGEFDVKGYIEVLRDMGYDGPWGIEVLNEELSLKPISEIFDRMAATAYAQFNA
jgi:sugar phosphate isomerase/epimerase